jgi:hypothetical protein
MIGVDNGLDMPADRRNGRRSCLNSSMRLLEISAACELIRAVLTTGHPD